MVTAESSFSQVSYLFSVNGVRDNERLGSACAVLDTYISAWCKRIFEIAAYFIVGFIG